MPNDEHDNLMDLHDSDRLDIFDGYGDYDDGDLLDDSDRLDIFDGYGDYDDDDYYDHDYDDVFERIFD